MLNRLVGWIVGIGALFGGLAFLFKLGKISGRQDIEADLMQFELDIRREVQENEDFFDSLTDDEVADRLFDDFLD